MSVEQDAARLAAKFQALQEGATRIMQQEVKRSSLNIETAAKRRVRVDRGGLRNSITHEIDADGLGSTIGTNSEYALATEFGRRPGSHPPVDPIIAWAKRKGFADPVGAAWAIARNMEKFGTDPNPFLFPSWEEEVPKFEARIRERITKLARDMSGPGSPPAAAAAGAA